MKKRKQILYVTPLVRAMEDLLKGDTEAKGLPSQILPLKYLLQHGYDVDIVLVSNYKGKIDIKVDWLSNQNILANINNDLVSSNRLIKIINTLKSTHEVLQTLTQAIKHKKYDFIYCHGTAAVFGNIVANLFHIPCGYRLYGTFDLYNDIESLGNFKSKIRHIKEYIIFKLPKKFMLITDDGSNGDKVYQKWKSVKKPYPLYFWVNGVDIESINELENTGTVPNNPYIFVAGRIDSCKGQDKIIDMLHILHNDNRMLHLYIAGHVEERKYKDLLVKKINDYCLSDYVHFMGPIGRGFMKKMGYYAQSAVIWQDFSQRGNVFYELFSVGSIIVTKNDGSLDGFVSDKKNILLSNDIYDAVNNIEIAIQMTQEKKENVRNCAISQCKSTIGTWTDRVNKEVRLIDQSIVGIE